MNTEQIIQILADQAQDLLSHTCHTISKDKLQVPDEDFVDKVFLNSDRKPQVINNLQKLFSHGRLADTGYINILPVDQGVEHSAGAVFAPNPDYFDPENIVKLAVEAGCNGVASTFGVLAALSRKYAHKIPFIVKVNHNQLLTFPTQYDEIPFCSVKQAWDLGASGIGATIYFGSKESNRQIQGISEMFAQAHDLGMFTILWCYTRNDAFVTPENDYHFAADITGQANHLGATIGADIVKQKLPVNNGGFRALKFGKYSNEMYTQLATDHPIDLVRYQVANSYMGKIGLINSGGPSGNDDLAEAVKTAVINKRGGGMGLICGRKAFQKPLADGIDLLNTIQDVYLNKDITIA